MSTAGQRFRLAVEQEKPLQVVGAVNAYAARLAEHSGFKALYLSGGGVAACSCGIPDLGITTLEDVLIDVRRITDTTDLPLLVDIDHLHEIKNKSRKKWLIDVSLKHQFVLTELNTRVTRSEYMGEDYGGNA